MARHINWQIRFKSLGGVDCVVSIHKDSAPSSGVRQLTPGAVPVYWEEEKSDDVLMTVRTKSGYISFIEESFGEHDDVYPATNTDRFVTVEYGSRMVFAGYLKPETFENAYAAPPREIQIPIMSPLLASKTIAFDTVSPRMVSLAQSLKWAIGKTGGAYKYVYMPTSVRLTDVFRASLLSPYNDKFNRSQLGLDTPAQVPVDIYTFLEGVCDAYGLMLHETPDTLFFTRFAAARRAEYYRYNVSDLPSVVIPSVPTWLGPVSFDERFTISSDQCTVSSVQPLSRIDLDFGSEELDETGMDLGRCRLSTVVYPGGLLGGVSLVAIQRSMSDEVSGGMLLDTNTIDANYRMATPGAMAASIAEYDKSDGHPTVRSGILVQTSRNWAAGTELFRVRMRVPVSAPHIGTLSILYGLRVRMSWASNLRDENFHSDDHGDFGLRIGWKFDDQPDPSDSDYHNVPISGGTGEVKDESHKYEYTIRGYEHYDYMTVIVRCGNMSYIRDNELLLFEDIGFVKFERAELNDLSNPPSDFAIRSDNGSVDTAEVSQFITPHRYGRNLVSPPYPSVSTPSPSGYAHLLVSQRHYEIDARMSDGEDMTDLIYGQCVQLSTPAGTVDTRVLGISFTPGDDEYNIALQTFDQ